MGNAALSHSVTTALFVIVLVYASTVSPASAQQGGAGASAQQGSSGRLFYVPTADTYAMYYLTEPDPRGALGLGGKEERNL